MATESDRSPSTKQLAGSEGTPIFSADQKAVGHVKEVAGTYFKVDAPRAQDYWLSQDEVQLASANQVILNCAKDDIRRYKRDRPGPGPTASADGPTTDDEPRGDIIA